MSLKLSVEQLQQHLHHAQDDVNQALQALGQFRTVYAQSEDIVPSEADALMGYRCLQLMLQYRLSNQDALRNLLHCQQSLWQILGVSPGSSPVVNYERLAYALGSDDLHVLLSMLSQLADALLKLIARLYRKELNKQFDKKEKEKLAKQLEANRDLAKAYEHLKKAVDKQEEVKEETADLMQRFQVFGGAPDIGEVLDHLSQLQGPISRFHQALQNGLVLAGSLYQQLSKKYNIIPELKSVLQQVHDTLNLAAPHLSDQRFFVPEPQTTLSSQQLEERAASKRLRNFFGR